MHEPHLDLTMHQSKQQDQQHQVCPTSDYIKHFKNTKSNIVLFVSHDKQFSKLQQNSFNPAPDNTSLLTVQPLSKVAPRKEVPMFVTSGVCTDFVILYWVTGILQSPTNYYNGSKDPNMSKKFTAGYKKHIILTNPEKLDIIILYFWLQETHNFNKS
jgi:hypothetical protein